MAKMLAFQVARPTGPLELVERPIPEPGPGMVALEWLGQDLDVVEPG